MSLHEPTYCPRTAQHCTWPYVAEGCGFEHWLEEFIDRIHEAAARGALVRPGVANWGMPCLQAPCSGGLPRADAAGWLRASSECPQKHLGSSTGVLGEPPGVEQDPRPGSQQDRAHDLGAAHTWLCQHVRHGTALAKISKSNIQHYWALLCLGAESHELQVRTNVGSVLSPISLLGLEGGGYLQGCCLLLVASWVCRRPRWVPCNSGGTEGHARGCLPPGLSEALGVVLHGWAVCGRGVP